MPFTYTDQNTKIVTEAWGTFKAIVTETVDVGDLLNFAATSTTRAVSLADDSDNKPASLVGVTPGKAGDEITVAKGAVLVAPSSVSLIGAITPTYFANSVDFFGSPLYLGEAGKPSDTVGDTCPQYVGYLIARDTILLDPSSNALSQQSRVLPVSAVVVAVSDVPAKVTTQYTYIKPWWGNLVQLCGAVSGQIEIQAAIDAVS